MAPYATREAKSATTTIGYWILITSENKWIAKSAFAKNCSRKIDSNKIGCTKTDSNKTDSNKTDFIKVDFSKNAIRKKFFSKVDSNDSDVIDYGKNSPRKIDSRKTARSTQKQQK